MNENRNQCLQHGDFHVGNLIVNKNLDIGVVDFNRFDYGDPIDEFNRINLSSRISPEFASGQIDGYYNNAVPNSFFKLLKFYSFANIIGNLPWAINYGDAEIEFALKSIEYCFDSYSKYLYPNWYKENFVKFENN